MPLSQERQRRPCQLLNVCECGEAKDTCVVMHKEAAAKQQMQSSQADNATLHAKRLLTHPSPNMHTHWTSQEPREPSRSDLCRMMFTTPILTYSKVDV